jgi:hypothetical protein
MAWRPDYVSLADAREYVTRSGVMVDDAEIALAITTASRGCDTHTNRQFGRLDVAATWSYHAWWNADRGRWIVNIDDLPSVAGLAVDVPTVGTTATYDPEPDDALDKGEVYTRLAFRADSPVLPSADDEYLVKVTSRFGWLTVPTEVAMATRLQTSRLLARRDSPFGIAGSPEQGSELRLLARLDPDVAVSLRGLVRPRRAG